MRSRLMMLWIGLAAIGASALLFVHRLEPWGDALDYLLMAKTVLAGDWSLLPSWRYPPVFPGWLALWLLPFGVDALGGDGLVSVSTGMLYWLKTSGLLLHAVSAGLVWCWTRTIGIGFGAGLLIALLYAVNQHIAVTASLIGAEALMAVFFWACLWLVEDGTGQAAGNRKAAWLVAVFAVLALMTRSVAVALPAGLGGWLAVDAWRSRSFHRIRVWWPAVVLPAVAFVLYSASGSSDTVKFVTTGSDYMALEYDVDRPIMVRLLDNAVQSFPMIANICLPKMLDETGLLQQLGLGGISLPLIVIFSGLMLTGMAVSLLRKMTVSHAVAAVYLLAVFMTLSPKGRYYLPLVPVFLWWAIQPFAVSGSAGRLPVLRVAGGILFLWIALTTVLAGAKNWRNIVAFQGLEAWDPARYSAAAEDDYAGMARMALWLRDHTGSGAVVLASKAPLVELIAKRRTLYIQSLYEVEDKGAALLALSGADGLFLVEDFLDPASRAAKARMSVLAELHANQRLRLDLLDATDAGNIYRVDLHSGREEGSQPDVTEGRLP